MKLPKNKWLWIGGAAAALMIMKQREAAKVAPVKAAPVTDPHVATGNDVFSNYRNSSY
jgi:hypothetical protein